ncbi:hypothetical protein [Mucilaginibacter ginsenosidivorans]|uniref:Uncharacterized protein n=1 Tax=Mucilaginibacter ginsenosidivorans TaxID=398053 RepID=A0A5B8UW78_9SPHI|nr:hypothetical protein [Mucilaginibacter ginsenosidivorans]QEC63387.1 hypothetical protein FRZ54_12650 [Mucilaginibacter ginsenosidivorans]
MATFIPRTNRHSMKASEYFIKLSAELDLEKYKLQKYKELFMLASFQLMHDADLAYYDIYTKCSKNASSKDSLLSCLEQEEQLSYKNPDCFDNNTYRQSLLKVASEIKHQLVSGSLDFLFM